MSARYRGFIFTHALWMAAWAGGMVTAQAADLRAGQKIAETVCAACHGKDGNGTAPVNPKLAGQHAGYLLKQMKDFTTDKSGQVKRSDPVMNGMMITNYSEQQLQDVAAWYASLEQKGAMARNLNTLRQGEKIYRAGIAASGVPACAACHGPNGKGIPPQYPRISGQYAEYLEKQMFAFREGSRSNDHNSIMRDIAAKMTDEEIKAVVNYVAGLR